MTRECIVCGSTLRTGRKYCWRHRNAGSRDTNDNYNEGPAVILLIAVVVIMIIGYALQTRIYHGKRSDGCFRERSRPGYSEAKNHRSPWRN